MADKGTTTAPMSAETQSASTVAAATRGASRFAAHASCYREREVRHEQTHVGSWRTEVTGKSAAERARNAGVGGVGGEGPRRSCRYREAFGSAPLGRFWRTGGVRISPPGFVVQQSDQKTEALPSGSNKKPNNVWGMWETWRLVVAVVIGLVCVICLVVVLQDPNSSTARWAARISGWAVALNAVFALIHMRLRRDR